MRHRRALEIGATVVLLLTVTAAGVGFLAWREHQRRLNEALATAMIDWDLRAIRSLVRQGADVRTRAEVGGTVLHQTAGDATLLKEFLARSPSADLRGNVNETPLMNAARGGSAACARLLLDRGADVNAADAGGMTPLMNAASADAVSMVRFLISRGADLKARDADGRTALMVASWNGNPGAVEALLDLGADPLARSGKGQTSLDLVRAGGLRLPWKRRQSGRVIRLLQQATGHP